MKASKVMSKSSGPASTCAHADGTEDKGLALVAVGPRINRASPFSFNLCNALPESSVENVCRYNLSSYKGKLADCLSGHRAAIIVDSSCNGVAPGTIMICDLSHLLRSGFGFDIDTGCERELVNELQAAKNSGHLPSRIVMFAIGADSAKSAGDVEASNAGTMVQSVKRLSVLVSTVLNTVKKDS